MSWSEDTAIRILTVTTDASGVSPSISVQTDLYLLASGTPDPVALLHAGDADEDSEFDQNDVAQVALAGKYLTANLPFGAKVIGTYSGEGGKAARLWAMASSINWILSPP